MFVARTVQNTDNTLRQFDGLVYVKHGGTQSTGWTLKD